MKKDNQDRFYQSLGRLVTKKREELGLTIYSLAKEVDEQYNTVKGIEAGNNCSMHHMGWMQDVLGINFDEEGEGDEQPTSINDLI